MSADYYYSVDSSALIHGWVRAYPLEIPIFEPVWQRMSDLIAEGRLRASIEVLSEIKKKEDDLAKWCEAQTGFFVDIEGDVIQEKVAGILKKYPRLVDTRKGRSGADPFVVALSLIHNKPLTVVTEERGGTAEKPKIPYVCQEEGLRCISLLQLITEQS